MAKIPLGNFGNQIARSPGVVNSNPSAFSSGAEAIQRAAGGLMSFLEQRQQDERQQQQMLDRAKAANSVLDREIQVDAIHGEISQQVADGTIHYSDAKNVYKQKLADLGAPDIKGLDPVTAENLSKGFKRADFKGENVVEGMVIKAKTADFRAQTDGILDKLGKQAGLPNSDMATLGKQLDSMDEIGRQAYGAAWEKRKQDWKDNSWDAKLNQQAMVSRNDIKSIDSLQKQITEGDYADKLDSNRRNSLVAKLDGYKTSLIQRQEAAASRAQRQQEIALKRAESVFNTFQGMADKGTILAPEYIDRAISETNGTPYQAGIVAMSRQAQETGGIAAQPIRNQQALLTQVDTLIAKQGRTPEIDKRREQIAKVLNSSQSDLKENGLRAGLERGVIADMAPLDVSSPEAMAGSFSKRIEQADHVSAWAGKAVSPLDENEAEQVRNIMDALPPKQRAAAVATIAQSVGPRYASAIAQQLDSKDKALSLAFSMAGDKTTSDRFTSELSFKGSQAIKDGTAMKDDKKVTGWKASIAKEIDGALPDERAATAVKESAYFIAAGIAAENGGNVGSDDISRAVRLAIGGSIIERNGKKLPIPAGMDDGDFESRIKSVSPNDILKQAPEGNVRVGGAEMSAQEFAASIPGQELMYAGPGRYAVIVRGRPVTNSAGRPIIIGVK